MFTFLSAVYLFLHTVAENGLYRSPDDGDDGGCEWSLLERMRTRKNGLDGRKSEPVAIHAPQIRRGLPSVEPGLTLWEAGV